MGCGDSKGFGNVYTTYPTLKPYQEGFERLGLCERDIGKFYERFLENKIDAKNNCRIKEVIFHMHCNDGALMTRYWKSVAKNPESGYISFQEYVLGFWNLLSLRPLQKTYDRFTFDLYADKNGNKKGHLSCMAVKLILDDIYGTKKDFMYKKAVKALQDPKTPSWLTLADWSIFTENNEGVLMPLQELLNKERFKLMGKQYWEKKMTERKNFSRGKSYLTLQETLTATGVSMLSSQDYSHALNRSTSARSESLSKKPSSSGRKAGIGPKSYSQSTLLQGSSCNSINVDG